MAVNTKRWSSDGDGDSTTLEITDDYDDGDFDPAFPISGMLVLRNREASGGAVIFISFDGTVTHLDLYPGEILTLGVDDLRGILPTFPRKVWLKADTEDGAAYSLTLGG